MLFSVIIPLFNKQSYIVDTILSVSAQDFSDFEIIIVDDGSTDSGVDKIRPIVDHRTRLIYQDNAGPGLARNRGAMEGNGEWLAFVDADDIWAANHLTILKDLILGTPNAHVVATTSRQFDHSTMDSARKAASGKPCFQIDYLADAGERFVHTSSIAVRRSTFLAIGGFGSFFPGEDTELWVRLALEHAFVISSARTSGYRRSTGGIMEQFETRNAPPADPGEAPVQATLEHALGNPMYALRHLAIHAYLDRARYRVARIALVRGYPIVARKHLKAITSNSHMKFSIYLAMTWIPRPFFKVFMVLLRSKRYVLA